MNSLIYVYKWFHIKNILGKIKLDIQPLGHPVEEKEQLAPRSYLIQQFFNSICDEEKHYHPVLESSI